MSDVQYTEINTEEAGQRLDNYLLRFLKGVPKSHIYRMIRAGEVRINKKRARVFTRLVSGDQVRIPPVRCSAEKVIYVGNQLSQLLQASILFEDDTLLVLNKPAGIAVHGGSGLSLGVIEALRQIRKDLTYLELVHRLDKETSGCLLIAKKRSQLKATQNLLEKRQVHKTYWAIVSNPWVGKKNILVDVALQKNTLKSGERMVTIQKNGKSAQTNFMLIENYEQACWLAIAPKTGRTHQIRVHSAYLNHPIIGDKKYNQLPPIENLESGDIRLYLHARAIQFCLDGKEYQFEAGLDKQFINTLKKLGTRSPFVHA